MGVLGVREPPNMSTRNESRRTGASTVRLPTSMSIVEISPPQVGRSRWARPIQSTASHFAMKVTCPPRISTGRVASCRPPTWKSGIDTSAWSAAVSP